MIAAIALDLGSTSIKAGLLEQNGMLAHTVAKDAPPIMAAGAHYESDAQLYAEIADQVLMACLSHTDSRPPLGLCSQRSSFLIWDAASGKPITPLISWQDKRGEESCIALQAKEPLITRLTGLRLTPYYFAAKLRVVLRENPQWYGQLLKRELLLGTLDTFLIWRWTGGAQYLTDASMAARTLLMDIHQQQWSSVLCELFSVPSGILPRIKPSTGLNLPLHNGLTLQASVADQSAALLACVGEDGETALVNLGTGGFVIRYIDKHDEGGDGYLRTLVYQNHALKTRLAKEGTLNSIAAALAPYPVADCELGDLAASDIFCLAEPSGIGAPYFRKDLGLKFSAPVAHLSPKQTACLLLEAIIFRVLRILEEFHQDSPLSRVYLSGGLSALSSLQQGIAQSLPFEVCILHQRDASLQGAAMLAAGLDLASRAEVKIIQVNHPNTALQQKYLRWKDWLDGLLVQ